MIGHYKRSVSISATLDRNRRTRSRDKWQRLEDGVRKTEGILVEEEFSSRKFNPWMMHDELLGVTSYREKTSSEFRSSLS